jgi:hypothetical protein
LARRLPFLVVLWLGSTLFTAAELGKYADDYFFAGRDPETGAPVALTPLAERPFYRPLTWLLVPALQRSFWFDDAALHVLSAAAHGLAVALLAALLLVTGRSPVATVAAAGLFLVAPAGYEVVFWSSALPTGLASSLFLVVCLWTVRHARRSPGAAGPTALLLVAIGLAAFAIPCLNEQPAAGLAALPLLHLACLPRERAIGPRERRAALSVGLAAWSGPGLYGALFWVTSSPGMRGTASSVPSLEALPGEASRLAAEVLARLLLRDFGSGALAAGVESFLESRFLAGALLVAFASSAWLALRPAALVAAGSSGDAPRAGRPLLLACFGIAVFVLDWTPLLAAAGTPVSSRLAYAPSLGLAIAGAAALDLAARGRRSAARSLTASCAAAALALVLALGCIAMVGIQAGFRARSRADAALVDALRRALPAPAPGALLLFVDDARRPVATGALRFDTALASPLALPQAASPYIRWAYRRRDLLAAQPTAWSSVAIAETAAEGALLVGLEPAYSGALPTDPAGGVLVPWERIVPLAIGADGTVTLVPRAAVRPSR